MQIRTVLTMGRWQIEMWPMDGTRLRGLFHCCRDAETPGMPSHRRLKGSEKEQRGGIRRTAFRGEGRMRQR